MIEESWLTKGQACRTIEISRGTYYRWKKPRQERSTLRTIIREIVGQFPRYGYRRITKALFRKGVVANHKRVLRIMREEKLIYTRKRFSPMTTNTNHWYDVYPNLVKEIQINPLNRIWVSDITYIRLDRSLCILLL